MLRITSENIKTHFKNSEFSISEYLSSKSREKSLKFRCIQCNEIFFKTKRDVQVAIKHKKRFKFCSNDCNIKSSQSGNSVMNCSNCDVLMIKKPSELKRLKSDRAFCSRNCAASYNNQKNIHPKRKAVDKLCKKSDCNSKVMKNSLFCKSCKTQINTEYELKVKKLSKLTLQELTYNNTNNIQSKNSTIREHARRLVSNRIQVCACCGYDKYVQCCHIKPISQFSSESLLSDVNNPKNLILLCPNCHVELDKLKDLSKLKHIEHNKYIQWVIENAIK